MHTQRFSFGRRDFLKRAGTGIAAGAAWCAVPRVRSAPAANGGRPNVLFIIFDDLNDWVGCLGGHPDVKTPNVDRLAQRGVLFTNAHACATVCGPSRIALLTGVRPSTSGIWSNNQDMRESPVLKNAVTLPQYFRKHGYTSVMYGKVFDLVDPDPPSWDAYWPRKNRWRKGRVARQAKRMQEKWDWYMNWSEPPRVTPDQKLHMGGPADKSVDQTRDGATAKRAVEFLQQEHEKPFFLAVGITKPHAGWSVPKAFHDMYPPESVHLPPEREHDLADVPDAHQQLGYVDGYDRLVHKRGVARRGVSSYLACVSFADAMAGRVLDALANSPYADNTLIVLCSDQGHHIGTKRRWSKASLWEESTRIPLILAGPALPRGLRVGAPVDLVNVYPTVARLGKLPPVGGSEGHDMTSLIRDPARKWGYAALTTQLGKHHAVRTEQWRYIRYADGAEELYDHKNDPNEWFNLAEAPGYEQIKKELAAHMPAGDAPVVPFAMPPHELLDEN